MNSRILIKILITAVFIFILALPTAALADENNNTTYYINEEAEDEFNIKLSAYSYEYRAKDIGPGVTVTDNNGKKLVYKTDYTLTYQAGRTDVGTYSITVIILVSIRTECLKQFILTLHQRTLTNVLQKYLSLNMSTQERI